jgi:hypothetical protein
VGQQQGVDQGGDLIQVELGRRVGVEHRRVVDVVDRPVSAASTVSSWTLTFVLMRAAICGGRAPIRVGWTPLPSTRQGTSTVQPVGRSSISPSLATLP